MATLIVKDLDTHHELDFRAMSCIRGGGARGCSAGSSLTWPPALARLLS